MAVQQLQLLNDNSTFANFNAWAGAIDSWFATSGWIQTNDTGQWMRSGMSITAVSMSGSNMTCTYTSLTGVTVYVGQCLTVTGWTGGNTGNNGTFVVTAIGAGTWTAVNASGVNVASGGTGVVTQQSTAPGSGGTVFSIWQPNDGMTNFYLRMDYGNFSGQTNSPIFKYQIGSGTNGSGTLTGLTTGQITSCVNTPGSAGTSIQYDCRFSSASGRLSFCLWRGANLNQQQFFSIERSLNSSGTYIGTYVTVLCIGFNSNGSQSSANQVSFVFGVGSAPVQTAAVGGARGGLSAMTPFQGQNQNCLFNNLIPVDFVRPFIGYYDYPMTTTGCFPNGNAVEGMIIQVTLYGSAKSYIMTSNQNGVQEAWGNNGTNTGNYLLMRYD